MDNIFSHLEFLETTAIARVEQWSEEERQSKELQQQEKQREQQAREQKRAALEDLWVIREAKAEVAALGGGGGEVAVSPEGVVDAAVAEVERAPDAEREVGTGHDGPPWVFNRPFFRFLRPRKDPQTGEPLYDFKAVSGSSYRERAFHAARVYGPELRESSLAEAIYATGETNANDPTSVRTSLGSLVRYGDQWTREKGWLVYRGDDLVPNTDLIKALAEERRANKFETDDI